MADHVEPGRADAWGNPLKAEDVFPWRWQCSLCHEVGVLMKDSGAPALF